LAGTRTLRSTSPSPAWQPSSAPGCSAEFGDDPRRYVSAKARRNYGGTSPITRASGKKKVVAARFIHNDRLVDALMSWAFSSLKAFPGAGADAITALRCRGASSHWEQVWQRPRNQTATA
jgi:hypothetical protein